MSDAQKKLEIEKQYEQAKTRFPNVADVTADELTQLRKDSSVVIVDVRTEEERAVSWIPGSISKDEFESRRAEFADSKIVAHCTIGYRSGMYAQELLASGVDVLNLRGSILSWTHAGGELENDQGPTKRVHVYGKPWNLAAEEYEAVW